MGFFDEDTGEMLEIYLLETNQLLDQSDAILLSAEQEMVFSRESINGIFRVMHTIKSSSAMMGLTRTVSFGPPPGRLICGVSGRTFQAYRL